MIVTIFDFLPASEAEADERAYQLFLLQNPRAIVVNEGEEGERDKAHRATCQFANVRSSKQMRWAKFCFQTATVLADIDTWYQKKWFDRPKPVGCKVCKPELPYPST